MFRKVVILVATELDQALLHLCEREKLNDSGLSVGRAFAVSGKTGDRILAGKWNRYVTKLGRAFDTKYGLAVLTALFSHSQKWRFVESNPCGDIDGDGDVDKHDAIQGCVCVAQKFADTLAGVNQTNAAGHYSRATADFACATIDETARRLEQMKVAIRANTVADRGHP